MKQKIIKRFVSRQYTIDRKRYILLSRNQLLILDALMNDGGYVKKYVDKKQRLRFSEHFGMLDFNKSGLEKIIVSGKTDRMDEHDTEILLPGDVPDALDYEYIFHTHPPTPEPGSRAKEGVLYEFPSIDDIYHFAEHFNEGSTQGSIVIAPEGLYLITSTRDSRLQIPKSEKVYHQMVRELSDIQALAIKKYGSDITEKVFHRKVGKDLSFLKMFNRMIKKHWGGGIRVSYKARVYDQELRKWIIPGVYLPVRVIEPRNHA